MCEPPSFWLFALHSMFNLGEPESSTWYIRAMLLLYYPCFILRFTMVSYNLELSIFLVARSPNPGAQNDCGISFHKKTSSPVLCSNMSQLFNVKQRVSVVQCNSGFGIWKITSTYKTKNHVCQFNWLIQVRCRVIGTGNPQVRF